MMIVREAKTHFRTMANSKVAKSVVAGLLVTMFVIHTGSNVGKERRKVVVVMEVPHPGQFVHVKHVMSNSSEYGQRHHLADKEKPLVMPRKGENSVTKSKKEDDDDDGEEEEDEEEQGGSILKPFVGQTVDLVDSFFQANANEEVLMNYNVLKSQLILWNPEASKWASNASANYKEELRLPRDERHDKRLGDFWAGTAEGSATTQRQQRRMEEVESLVEQCGCRRSVLSGHRGVTDGSEEEEQGGVAAKNGTRPSSSTCSRHSVDRGYGQKVIGFSFYGNPQSKHGKERKYFQGIKDNLALIPLLYPGWTLRLYYDLQPDHPLMKDLCDLACRDSNIDLCYVRDIPDGGDVSKVFAMIWRFLPILDPQVDHYVSRDLDSLLNTREVAAVQEWLKSDKAFHFMRDHPAHSIEILGSAWGVRLRRLERKYAREAIAIATKDKMFWAPRSAYGPDQGFLKRYIWPWAKWSAVSHDSYTCLRFPRTSAFPVRRLMEPNNFVASVVQVNDTLLQVCPMKCRPKEHPDWKHC